MFNFRAIFGFPAVVFGWPVGVESGNSRFGRPFGINVDVGSGVDAQHVVTVRARPVKPLGWRRVRWLKRRGIIVVPAGSGPPLGSSSLGCGCDDVERGDSRRAPGHNIVDVDADAMVDGGCDGLSRCEERINIGHRTRRDLGDSAISLAVSGCLSSCPFVCPPPVRPAPGVSSFPSPSIPLPPAHSASCCDDVGDRRFSFGAGVSVARPCSSASVASVGSSVSSFDRLHPAGPRRSPSRSVVLHSSFSEILSD